MRNVFSRMLKVKVFITLSCPTLCGPMDCSPPGPSVLGILQAEYWSGLPFPFPRDLPDPGIEPRSLTLQADSLPSKLPGKMLEGEGIAKTSGL